MVATVSATKSSAVKDSLKSNSKFRFKKECRNKGKNQQFRRQKTPKPNL